MTEPRIASHLLVGALRRRAEDAGGFAAVLARGDAQAGAILALLSERGGAAAMLERMLEPDGRYAWRTIKGAGNAESTRLFLEKRRRNDPDLWIIELDVPSIERFTAEINA